MYNKACVSRILDCLCLHSRGLTTVSPPTLLDVFPNQLDVDDRIVLCCDHTCTGSVKKNVQSNNIRIDWLMMLIGSTYLLWLKLYQWSNGSPNWHCTVIHQTIMPSTLLLVLNISFSIALSNLTAQWVWWFSSA